MKPPLSALPRWRLVLTGAGLVATGAGLVALLLVLLTGPSNATPGVHHSHPARLRGAAALSRLQSLPLQAQSAISATLSSHAESFDAKHRPFGYELAGGGVAGELRSHGVAVRVRGGWLSLSLSRVGRGRTLRAPGRASLSARANRVLYQHDGLQEWYAAGPLGIEQGFVLQRKPSGVDRPLTLALRLGGSLRAQRVGQRVRFADSSGVVRALFGGVSALDARGRRLPAAVSLHGHLLILRVTDRRARYPLRIDPFIEQAELSASDGDAYNLFGASVAISTNTVVVGAPGATVDSHFAQGAVYVFEKPASGWASGVQSAKLSASDGEEQDALGSSVAISGTTIVAGAPKAKVGSNYGQGAVYVFEKPASGWASATETAKLSASDGAFDTSLGVSVAISGDTIAAGASAIFSPRANGAVYVFEKPASGWASATETAKLSASEGSGEEPLGASVAISGQTIAAGAALVATPELETRPKGAVYIFEEPPSGWANATETAKLTASDGAADDNLGSSVALSETAVAAGAPGATIGANPAQGAVYVFEKPATGWASATETAKLSASRGGAYERFGNSVVFSGETIVTGAPIATVATDVAQGAVYEFEKPPSGWAGATETAEFSAAGVGAEAGFGWSIGVSADTLVSGAPYLTLNSNTSQGEAFVFAFETAKSASEQIEALSLAVQGIGAGSSLSALLAEADAAVAASQTTGACGMLAAFINEVMAQSQSKLTAEQASELIAQAERIRVTLGCRASR